tara:strand:- start:1591 stop:2409 length:819 start_codon:yes stop_codon:yes gene_type:complete
MPPRIELLIIDPEVDFCVEGANPLFVKGADKDMSRLAKMVSRHSKSWFDIHITQDAHRWFDVGHPSFWVDAKNQHPDPFTFFDYGDVRKGKWRPVAHALTERMETYDEEIEKSARYPISVWCEHCLIGSPGMNIVADLFAAVSAWEVEKKTAWVDYVTKGSNPYTEHYSAVMAEVPDPADMSTQINTKLIETLKEADVVPVAGEAGSHCLANTVRDIANQFGDDAFVRKLILIEDATSPVGNFERQQDEFIQEMVGRGMQLTTTDKFDPRKI